MSLERLVHLEGQFRIDRRSVQFVGQVLAVVPLLVVISPSSPVVVGRFVVGRWEVGMCKSPPCSRVAGFEVVGRRLLRLCWERRVGCCCLGRISAAPLLCRQCSVGVLVVTTVGVFRLPQATTVQVAAKSGSHCVSVAVVMESSVVARCIDCKRV